jgi:uncharacterized protein (TIGR00251 family)
MSASLLSVRVTPRASRSGVSIDEAGTLQIRTTAPPANGAANKAVLKLVADALGIAKSSISIKSGETGRNKVIALAGLGESELNERLAALAKPKG